MADCYDNSLMMKICTLGMCENVSEYAKLMTSPFSWLSKLLSEQLGLPAEIGIFFIAMIIVWLAPTIVLLTFETAVALYPLIYAVVTQLIFSGAVKLGNIEWKKVITIVYRNGNC